VAGGWWLCWLCWCLVSLGSRGYSYRAVCSQCCSCRPTPHPTQRNTEYRRVHWGWCLVRRSTRPHPPTTSALPLLLCLRSPFLRSTTATWMI
jgi:hypothetical protein